MEAKKLIACASRLHILQAAYLTFNPGKDGIAGLRRFIGLTRSNQTVRIEPPGNVVPLLTVIQNGDWQRVSRTVMVYGLMHAEADFLTPMARDVESIATGEHGAKALFTSNTKRQQEAAAQIIASIMTPLFADHIKDWGCLIERELINHEGLPGIKFVVRSTSDNSPLVAVFLDGFTGRMAVNGDFGDTRYSHPDQLREAVMNALVQKLEGMTAP